MAPSLIKEADTAVAVAVNATTPAHKYYFFNGRRVVVCETTADGGSHFRYLHGDHLGSTVLMTYGSSGTQAAQRRYNAFGSSRQSVNNTIRTDHLWTGQKLDESGLYYFNARYYDPEIGQFISPDTIVPDPGRVFGYNRYMYGYGNPLKYTDPTGHYSDDALMTHFGCDDWACVEGQFGEGGQHAGRWGWLATLMAAEDGDMVTAWSVTESLYQEIQGTFRTVNGMIMVDPSRLHMNSPSWDKPVHLTELAGSFSELNFAAHGVGIAGMYDSSRGPSTVYNQYHIDCAHHGDECRDRAMNALGFGAAVVGAGCAIATAGGCVFVAGVAGGTINAGKVFFTANDVYNGNATVNELTGDVVSAGVDLVTPQKIGPVISGFQWWQDEQDNRRPGAR